VARFVLSDAGPLICLAQVNGLPWLEHLFGPIHITQQVRDEVLPGRDKPGETTLSAAIEKGALVVHPEWKWQEPRFLNLGSGEESCIGAAVNLRKAGNECLLLIDDREARRLASSLSIPIAGTAAVVGAAKKARLVASANAVFDKLHRSGFRISVEVVRGVLKEVGEGAEQAPQKPRTGVQDRRRKINRPRP
jgi:predicted nucleic acid-binding protein